MREEQVGESLAPLAMRQRQNELQFMPVACKRLRA